MVELPGRPGIHSACCHSNRLCLGSRRGVEREATGKHEAVTKLQVLAERIVDDAIAGGIASQKLLVERLYAMLNRHEIAGADGEAIQIRWENQMREAAAELDRLLGRERPPEADASVN